MDINIDELKASGLFVDKVAQEAVAPDDQPLPELGPSAIAKRVVLNGKEIEVYGTSETLSDLYDQLRSAGVTVGAPQPIAPGIEKASDEQLQQLAWQQFLAASHQHEFTYLLNANHTALRGCRCGLAFVGLMAGPSPSALQWHQIHESDEG